MFLFLVILIGFTALMRIIELKISANNKQQRLQSEELIEVPEKYFFLFIILHSSFLLAVPVEVYFRNLEFFPILGILSLLVYAICLILRVHVLWILRKNWNTKIIYSLEENSIITKGLYKYIRHPNYLIVILEIASLSLFHSAFFCFVIFSVLNGFLLSIRIPLEEKFLFSNPFYAKHFQNKKRFIPGVF